MAGHPIRKFQELLKYEKHEITSIYFYAILTGILQLSLPLGIQSIISFVLGGSISTSIVLLIILVVTGVLIGGILQINQMKIIEKIQQQLFVRYSFLYAHVIPRFNLKDVDGYYLPELTNRFFDTISLQKSISKILLEVPAATLQMIFGLILLSFYHPVFIFFGLLLMLVVVLILRFSGKVGFETALRESNYKYKVAGYLQELARAVISFKYLRDQHLHIQRTDEYVAHYLQARTDHFKVLLLQYWTLISFKVLITAGMLIVGALLLVNQQLNIGQFIAAEIVILLVITSVEKLILNLEKVYDLMTSIEKLTNVTDKKLEESGSKILDHKSGVSLLLQNLSFGYEDDKLILKDISFELKKGEKMCLMGGYSSGKSTLIKMLTGSYRPTEGILSLNGMPLSSYDINTVRKHTGIVLQQQEIFEGTLLENIVLSNDTEMINNVWELAEMVGLRPFIEKNPDGYNMMLRPNGQHLSGKIIKKILLLRALVNDPKMLLMEEPWLGLEEIYAQKIRHYLLHETSGTTVITISSDEEFAAQCDKTLVLENGRVKAFGKWDDIKTELGEQI